MLLVPFAVTINAIGQDENGNQNIVVVSYPPYYRYPGFYSNPYYNPYSYYTNPYSPFVNPYSPYSFSNPYSIYADPYSYQNSS